MTDAPEQVWIDHMPHEHHWHESAPIEGSQYAHEFSGPYVRADLHAAELARAYAEGLEDAAEIAARHSEHYKQGSDGRNTFILCASAIRALPNKYGKASQ